MLHLEVIRTTLNLTKRFLNRMFIIKYMKYKSSRRLNSPSSSSSPSSPRSSSNPACMADGTPWYSPTNWCDCGPSSTYAALPESSGASGANCAYASLPMTTIQPISTSAAPTNIPGQGGVPGCAAVTSSAGTSDCCNCGGTPAPTLSPTDSFINCDYTIQPTSSYDPGPPPPPSSSTSSASSTSEPPYATGKCNVHVWQGLGQMLSDPEVALEINITDANGANIGYNSSSLDWGEILGTDSKLPSVLLVTP